MFILIFKIWIDWGGGVFLEFFNFYCVFFIFRKFKMFVKGKSGFDKNNKYD